ncbi:LapA family protein [Streptomyces bicolor]|uniref:LapA family protein n=1 Tax=Streptomyces bicolor TaxID=66874 RepID=UPI0004E1286E|nr:LapA family protein [Streptomyces bicolor]
MTAKTSHSGRKAGGYRGSLGEWLTPARTTVLVLVVLSLIFIFENTRTTEIRLLVPEVTMPLWLALLGMGVIGALCGALFMSRRR